MSGEIHKHSAPRFVMSRPTDEDIEAMYWAKEGKQYRVRGKNGSYFIEGTPQRVLDSYELWKSRQ